jgi:hypothetical protein
MQVHLPVRLFLCVKNFVENFGKKCNKMENFPYLCKQACK